MFKSQVVMARAPKKTPTIQNDCDGSLDDPAPKCIISEQQDPDRPWFGLRGDLVSEGLNLFCIELYPTPKKRRYSILTNTRAMEKRQGITLEFARMATETEKRKPLYVYSVTIPALKKLRDDSEFKECFYDDFMKHFDN